MLLVSGVKEVREFLNSHPEILPQHSDREVLVRRKVFNERKQKRDRQRQQLTTMLQL